MSAAPYMKPEAVAKRLGVTRPTVLAMARAGKLPYIQLTERIYRFDPEDVEAAVKAMKKGKVG